VGSGLGGEERRAPALVFCHSRYTVAVAEDLDVLTRSRLRSMWSLPDRVAIDESGGAQVVRVSPTRLLANLRATGIPGTETATALTVLRRHPDIRFGFDGPFVEFDTTDDLESAVGILAERGVATTPPTVHIMVRRAAAGWWDVAVPRAQASVTLVAHALQHTTKVTGSYDSAAVHARRPRHRPAPRRRRRRRASGVGCPCPTCHVRA